MTGFARLFALFGVIALFLYGCSAVPVEEPDTAAGEPEEIIEAPQEPLAGEEFDVEDGEADTMGIEEPLGFRGDPLDDPDSLLAKRVVYFDFDSAVVKDDFSVIVEAHAGYLTDHPGARVTLEGHGDERGTREYNLGLGERRAQAIQQFLLLLGASNQQIQTVSYGEERPASLNHDEEGWQLNRRVEFVYER